MAQPYDELWEYLEISPKITCDLNNKLKMDEIFPEENLCERYAIVNNWKELQKVQSNQIKFPCFFKVSRSSASDGVRKIENKEDLKNVKKEFENIDMEMFFEEYWEWKSINITFAIRKDWKTWIIWNNIQYVKEWTLLWTCVEKDFLIDQKEYSTRIKSLFNQVIQKVIKKGWYWIWWVDIIIPDSWILKAIDPNFRTNMSTAFLINSRNWTLKTNWITFTWSFEEQNLKKVENLINQGILTVISVVNIPNTKEYYWTFNLCYDQIETIWGNAISSIEAWVKSDTLKNLKDITKDSLYSNM